MVNIAKYSIPCMDPMLLAFMDAMVLNKSFGETFRALHLEVKEHLQPSHASATAVSRVAQVTYVNQVLT